MFLTRLGSSGSLLVYLVIVLAAHSTAQDGTESSVTIDFSGPQTPLNRMITVSPVTNLTLLLPNDAILVNTTSAFSVMPCQNSSGVCYVIDTQDMYRGELNVVFPNMILVLEIVVDNRFGAACKEYILPKNATMRGGDNPPEQVTLTCEPVSTQNLTMNWSNATINWREFKSRDLMEKYIENSNCSSRCCETNSTDVIGNSSYFTVVDYNLTILQPEMNQSWFMPTFDMENCTYFAPGTYLYRWPRITSHYEFSLEVQEETMNYSKLECEVDSFPESSITWKRDSNMLNMSRYILSDIVRDVNSEDKQRTLNGSVTIKKVQFEDSKTFTCEVVHPASQVGTPTLDVRIRVKGRLRPLWPAIGIVAVGIIVALFIIIGHFVDQTIEKCRNDPSNPTHHKRLQSITSTMENDNSSNNLLAKYDKTKATSASHEPVKRLSSARLQLLEEPQT